MVMRVDWLIVGSGPSGCAAASALIRCGVVPTILDGGIKSTPLSGRFEVGDRREPGRKAWHGSTGAYQQLDVPLFTYADRVVARASYGRGGFSRVWGATASVPRDWSRWPENCRPSLQDMALLWSFLPKATTGWGDVNTLGPDVVPGSSASLKFMEAAAAACLDGDWEICPSTLAIDTRHLNRCRPCARCLTGCPKDSIWFSGAQIDEWAKSGQVHYLPGFSVITTEEEENHVKIRVRLGDSAISEIYAQQVLIGAGPLSSAAIAVKSGLQESVRIQDTATAFAGVVGSGGGKTSDEFHHGLSQWWIRDRHDKLLVQVYPPAVENSKRLATRLPWSRLWERPSRLMARHLHPLVAYLHQDDSGELIVSKSGRGIAVEEYKEENRASFVGHLASLAKGFRAAGYWMPAWAAEFTPPGSGYHMGSSMPHGRLTDRLGRPEGLRRVHFIDSSVLPFLDLGSITPTVMLNAIRIARQSFEEFG